MKARRKLVKIIGRMKKVEEEEKTDPSESYWLPALNLGLGGATHRREILSFCCLTNIHRGENKLNI